MTTIINAADPAEFLGLVPALAGFTPRRSVVLLPFRGTRTQGAMRVDLPDPGADPDEFAAAALRALLQVPDTDAVALVVYTDDPPAHLPDGVLLPHVPLAEALVDVCAQTGLRVVEALCVTGDGWGDYLDEVPAVRPLTDIPPMPAVPGIGDVSGDQLAGSALPRSDLAERERVGRALRDLTAMLERGDGSAPARTGALLTAGLMTDDLPHFAERLLDAPSDADPQTCAALLWCLNRPTLRDALLVQWATDLEFGRLALDAQLAFASEHADVPDAIGEVFLGRGPRPDADRLGCALQVVRMAAARAPREARVGALVAAAWLSWALGRSSHAGAYVDEALSIDPHHSMASLSASILAAAMLPEWTLSRP